MELAARYSRQTFEDMTVRQLVTWLKERTDEYTNDQPTVSDKVFDLGEKVLKERAPKNAYFGLVGAPVKKGKKEKLPIAMGSLSKVKPADGIEGWLKKAGSTITVSDKLDGISGQVNTQNGEKMYTRGDGIFGQDISELIEVVDGIGTLRKNEAVRGELVMAKKKFKGKLSKLFENTRNVVAGVANSTDKAGHVAASSITFVAYEMLKPNKPLAQSATYLKQKGFNVVKFKVFNNPTVAQLLDYFKQRKSKSLYELDGLVLESAKAGTVAFKVATEAVQTTVEAIEWRLTRYGVYAPKIKLKPVRHPTGVTIRNASAYNARYLKDMGIGPGAVVMVDRSGDVIPKVVDVVKKTKLSEPDGPYEWDANNVQYILPKDEDEPTKVVADRITNALVVLGVPGVRSGLVAKLVADGVNSLEELILLDEKELLEAGMGPTQARTLHNELSKVLKRVDHATMMKASGIWPKGFGETIFNKVLANLSYQEMTKLTPRALYNTMVDNGVLKEATALKFAKEFKNYRKFVDSVDFTPVKRKTNKNDSLNGVNIAFTGFRNKSLEDILKSRGAKVNSSVKKETNVLLVPAKNHRSVKTEKAEKNGIEVLDLTTFLKKHKINL